MNFYYEVAATVGQTAVSVLNPLFGSRRFAPIFCKLFALTTSTMQRDL